MKDLLSKEILRELGTELGFTELSSAPGIYEDLYYASIKIFKNVNGDKNLGMFKLGKDKPATYYFDVNSYRILSRHTYLAFVLWPQTIDSKMIFEYFYNNEEIKKPNELNLAVN
jgi:hypothetical protein